jgi:hypothetical protein
VDINSLDKKLDSFSNANIKQHSANSLKTSIGFGFYLKNLKELNDFYNTMIKLKEYFGKSFCFNLEFGCMPK